MYRYSHCCIGSNCRALESIVIRNDLEKQLAMVMGVIPQTLHSLPVIDILQFYIGMVPNLFIYMKRSIDLVCARTEVCHHDLNMVAEQWHNLPGPLQRGDLETATGEHLEHALSEVDSEE